VSCVSDASGLNVNYHNFLIIMRYFKHLYNGLDSLLVSTQFIIQDRNYTAISTITQSLLRCRIKIAYFSQQCATENIDIQGVGQ